MKLPHCWYEHGQEMTAGVGFVGFCKFKTLQDHNQDQGLKDEKPFLKLFRALLKIYQLFNRLTCLL